MSNTTKLPQPIFELVQTLLDVHSQMEDVAMEANSLVGEHGDAPVIYHAARNIIDSIDLALDLIKYND